MKKYSVWYLPYNKRYLLTHPWQWFKCVWCCIRDAWRRSVYGWTYGDVWDWNSWFLHTTPNMLRYMADKGAAYPGSEPFTTPEKWHDWLHKIADLLETGLEEWQDEHNEYHDEYIKHLMDNWEPPIKDENGCLIHKSREFTEIDKKYFARAKELNEQGQKNVQTALTEIAKNFFMIWD